MPIEKRLAFMEQPIGAAGRKPLVSLDIAGLELDAVRHSGKAVVIVPASAGGIIEQSAGDVREVDFTRVPVFQFVEAAPAASIAKGLPFGDAHLSQRLGFPERHTGLHLGSVARR